MLSITTLLISTGLALATTSLLNKNNNSSENNCNAAETKTRKEIKDFSYDKIKTVMEYELYGKCTSDLNEIARYNNIYEEGLSSNELAYKLANLAQHGNRIYPTYFVDNVEDSLNRKYN